MSNGTIIAPLTPDKNNEGYEEKPYYLNIPENSQNNKKEEKNKNNIKNCYKELKCFETIFYFLFLSIILSMITILIIQIVHSTFATTILPYSFFTIYAIYAYNEIFKQKYDNCCPIFVAIFVGSFCSSGDFIYNRLVIYKDIKIKNQFNANLIYCLKIGESFI